MLYRSVMLCPLRFAFRQIAGLRLPPDGLFVCLHSFLETDSASVLSVAFDVPSPPVGGKSCGPSNSIGDTSFEFTPGILRAGYKVI